METATLDPTPETGTAAASGASATDRFHADKGGALSVNTTTARVSLLASELIESIHDIVRRHQVSYDEYNALKAWLIGVGQDGEWPLFLDVWIEHAVEAVANADREGSKGTIEGPFYVPGAPALPAEATLPMRPDEPGTPLLFRGQVTGIDGTPLAGATVDVWHADSDGFYSQFAPGIPEWNLRGVVTTDQDGQFKIHTQQPAPYQIPTDGSCGKLIAAAGWHAWRPAHLHLKVEAPGHLLTTTQLYFDGGKYVEDDIASAVKPELILAPWDTEDGNGREVVYDFVLDPA